MNLETGQAIIDNVLHAVSRADKIPAKRYYDPAFYELEKEKLWPRVWQMACRLEEIQKPGDFVVYEIFDQSVIVTRVDASTIKAYHNHCRHRGVKLAEDRGHRPNGFICPFHGWRWSINGESTFVYEPEAYASDQTDKDDLALREVRVETWGGCAFINFDQNAPPLRPSIEPFASMHDAWKVESMRSEWWLSAKIPCNWKLAMEAFMEGYHVATTHPQLNPPGVSNRPGEHRYIKQPEGMNFGTNWITMGTGPMPAEVNSREFIEMSIHFMRVLSEGMAGMTHAQEIAVAEQLLDTELPKDPLEAMLAWRKILNNAIMKHYDDLGVPAGDLNEIDAKGWSTSVNFCFPHYFLLPTFGSASSYRIRPLGPEECLFELWSLTRYAPGTEPAPPKTPTPKAHNDPQWPAIPAQDYSNLPRQQQGLHTGGFEFMRLAKEVEGLVSNYQRLIDGYLADLDYDALLKAAPKVNGAIDVPVADLGF